MSQSILEFFRNLLSNETLRAEFVEGPAAEVGGADIDDLDAEGLDRAMSALRSEASASQRSMIDDMEARVRQSVLDVAPDSSADPGRGYERTSPNGQDGPPSNGYNPAYGQSGYDQYGYDSGGYDQYGYNADGYDQYGYNADGYDQYGYDRHGYDHDGMNSDGYDRYGYDQYGHNSDGYDQYGYNAEGYDGDGYDKYG